MTTPYGLTNVRTYFKLMHGSTAVYKFPIPYTLAVYKFGVTLIFIVRVNRPLVSGKYFKNNFQRLFWRARGTPTPATPRPSGWSTIFTASPETRIRGLASSLPITTGESCTGTYVGTTIYMPTLRPFL
jgi:hypothetical protein